MTSVFQPLLDALEAEGRLIRHAQTTAADGRQVLIVIDAAGVDGDIGTADDIAYLRRYIADEEGEIRLIGIGPSVADDSPLNVIPNIFGFGVEVERPEDSSLPGLFQFNVNTVPGTGPADTYIAIDAFSDPLLPDQIVRTGAFEDDDTFVGADGDDILTGRRGEDDLFGGAGRDLIYGNQDDDLVDGGPDADRLYGGDGDDTVIGGWGDDYIQGGKGGDILLGGKGFDSIYGGKGDDIIEGEDGTDWIRGGDGNDTIDGGSGLDTIYGNKGDDVIEGGKSNDLLRGDSGNDTIYGGQGKDWVRGGDDDDMLYGGASKDTLKGDEGDDILIGGQDRDILTGGAGRDIFAMSSGDGIDTVTDFAQGEDLIDLSGTGLGFDEIFLSQADSDAVIRAGDVRITLEDVAADDLSEADFLL